MLRGLGNLLVWSFRDGVSIVIRGCVGYTLSIILKFRTDPHFQLVVLTFGRVSHLWWTLLWVLRLGLERRLPMVLHSLALRDVVTLWVECVFILGGSEGLAVFAGVSSSVICHFSVSLAEWALVMFYSALCFVILRLGASRVECSSLPHSLIWLSP